MKEKRLIIFARYPTPGRAKTRLIPALGADGAAILYRRLTEETLGHARESAREGGVLLEVHYRGGNRRLMGEWLGEDLLYRRQRGRDLGSRMDNSFASAFGRGVEAAIIIGTDCPDLNARVMTDAWGALGMNDLVLGPAKDGGYYLIGLRRRIPELFIDMPWSSESLLARTLETAARLGLNVAQLATLSDVDNPEDLELLPAPTTEEIRVRAEGSLDASE